VLSVSPRNAAKGRILLGNVSTNPERSRRTADKENMKSENRRISSDSEKDPRISEKVCHEMHKNLKIGYLKSKEHQKNVKTRSGSHSGPECPSPRMSCDGPF
jgi:hypothetical protein